MSSRIFKSANLFAALMSGAILGGCSNKDNTAIPESDNPIVQSKPAAEPEPAIDDGKVLCALNGVTNLTAVCTHTVIEAAGSTQLLLEGPEGDFRRFTILKDGRGLETSDGAEPASISLLDGGKIEVSVGQDKYVLPAKVKPTIAGALPQESGAAAPSQPATAAPKP